MSTPSLLWHPVTWVFVSMAVLGGLTAEILTSHEGPVGVAPTDYGAVPEFSLVDQDNKPVTDADLRGHAWVGDFIFTSCPDACPALTATMGGVLPRISDPGVRLVSFSVDPETDTPERMATWSAQFHPPPGRWSFLTGNKDAVKAALTGFKVAADRVAGPDGNTSLVHSETFLLVDPNGHLRGYYGVDKAGLDALVADVAIVSAGR